MIHEFNNGATWLFETYLNFMVLTWSCICPASFRFGAIISGANINFLGVYFEAQMSVFLGGM